jgi:hypothetical protein
MEEKYRLNSLKSLNFVRYLYLFYKQKYNPMKLKLVSIIMLVMITLSSQAQYKKYTFGLKAAPHVGWMKPNLDTYEGNGTKVGFSWGFISEFGFSENHCLSTGFNVLFNGGNLKFPTKVDSISTQGTMERSYSLKSIELPLTLKMRTNAIGNMKYYGQIGLGTSFLLNAKKEDEYSYGSSSVSSAKAKYDEIFFIRESLIVGLGCEYTLGAGTILGAGLALNNGFTNILTDSNELTGKKEKASASFIELNVSVLF